jgi:predicted nucleic acid-binding protein
LQAHSASISFQVVQETLNVVTRKLPTPMTAEDAGRFLEQVLAPLWRGSPSLALYRRALDLQARYRYSFYDSLIVAAALDAGCSRLYSEDLHDGQRIEGLTIENPFVEL